MSLLTRFAALAVIVVAAPAHADRVVAVAPLSTLGTEDKSASTKKLIAQIEQAIGALAGTKVVPAAQVADAIAKAKKPQLKACEGDAACLAEVGKLVGAQVVVTGEVGGLGDSRIVYLGATDVTTGKELRSTTLAVGSKDENDTPAGAAIRLLDPEKYNGTVHLSIDAAGATVYVNGTKVTPSPKGELALPVGTQAIRVTHTEYHDFVKFVDVGYGRITEVAVGMKQYPIVEHDVRAAPTSRDKVEYIDPPMWRRWYVAAPAAVVLAVATGIVVGVLTYRSDRVHADACRELGGPNCTAP